MKKILFLFAMLINVAASAQSHINLEMLSATYTASPTVKFRVWWSSVPTVTGQMHNAKVWVWIDFLKLNADNTTTGNTWTRAEVSGTPVVSSSPTSTAALDASTNKGFWLNGVTGNYSATVTATLTNILSNTKFNWCAYVSDYPPNVTLDKGTYTFKGTTNFLVSNPTQTLTTKTIAKGNLTVNSSTTFTDATACPGIGSLYCPYTGSDLYMDATHLCQQRASGAQNWEAWIKDARDNELYRIVFMPDNKWWLAQNVKFKNSGSTITGCTIDECGKGYTYAEAYTSYDGGSSGSSGNVQGVCPPGWLLPIATTFNTLASSISAIQATATESLHSLNTTSCTKTNLYGFASTVGINNGNVDSIASCWYLNQGSWRDDGFCVGVYSYKSYSCTRYRAVCESGCVANKAVIRCYRQL